MKIAIYNHKGGVGKTMLTAQLMQVLDMQAVELDPYGNLHKLFEDQVIKLDLKDKMPNDDNLIYDFGGYADKRIRQIKDLDLIIIPTIPSIISLESTLESYRAVKGIANNILFVINCVLNEKDAEDAIAFLQESLQDELFFFVIPHTRALQTSENNCKSILEIANANGLTRHTYRKIVSSFKELKEIIEDSV